MSGSGIYEDEFEESDHESLYADSPSDGYFTQRDIPTETFVEQSSVQAESEAKARVAAENQSASSGAAPPSHTSPGSSFRSPVWSDEYTSLRDAGPAPPDYAAATADRNRGPALGGQARSVQTTATVNSRPPTSYGTIDRRRSGDGILSQSPERERPLGQWNNPSGPNIPFGPSGSPFGASGSPFGTRGSPFGPRENPFGPGGSPFGPSGSPFGLAGQPQSMRDSQDQDDRAGEQLGLLGRTQRTIWTPVQAGDAGKYRTGLRGTCTGRAPRNSRKRSEWSIYSSATKGTEHPQKGVCAFISFSEATFAIEDSATFALTEAMDSELYTSGGISGSIRLSVAPPEQENDVVVLVSYASTETWSVDDMDHFRALGVFELRFAKNRLPVPCIDVIIGLYIKAHVSLNSLNITTKNLDIQTGQSSSEDSNESAVPTTWAIDHAAFQSHRGSINVAPWSSRETRIVTDSGHISGRYELKDLLYLRTHSGQIEIDIAPQPADKAHPAPAVFDAQSHSGGIRVGVTSSLDIVERDYQTSVQTYSSSIQGTYIFSSSASFDTKSGSIEIDLLPYLDDDALRHAPSVSSSLRTESGSGHTELSLLPPVKHTSAVIKHLQSSHYSASGALDLVYPQAWEGAIEGATRSGGIKLEGKDVKVYYDGETGAGGRRVVARKGRADSKLGFQSQSGSVKVRVGDL
ncbi:hypothetical protein LTR35_012582 [Friedmanniomyces endolithicus]|uniref:Uncharacterized protein n=1 Tax=Friedmanniomyces endolithicus TaxID=329885 RepID=A0AAN6FL23_9PEZI|nr:hypothetical protein LTR35_012582 [Friedmanniomyces endolithicus]KAK0283892.1 hypothetical protein LTS00_011556 [Friedmanniomyces endolithicus]KAK0320395.1 hypothetical protein LTR82_008509 [Friedmanniomyces endolithicus]KAK0990379.1 hypothetical protein LTR54_012131 [Friedmanniomyces endolithicus]